MAQVSPPSSPRRAFTLIELLVVLGIMLVLGTIGVTAFARANRVNRLTATRDLVSDVVRQARATARATGFPVQVRIRQTVSASNVITGGSIAGVSQSRLLSLDFETPQADPAALDPDPKAFRSPFGSAGQGFILPAGSVSLAGDRPTLERRQQLRGHDGLVLSIAARVDPPTAGKVEPLVMLTTGSDDAGTSACGLRLLARSAPIFPNAIPDHRPNLVPPTGSTNPSRWSPDQVTWMLQGWLRPQGAAEPITISALLWPMDDAWDAWSTAPATRDEARLRLFTDGGGAWHTYGLSWDGAKVRLLRDGVAIAQEAFDQPLSDAQTVIVGHGTFPDWADEVHGTRPPQPWTAAMVGPGGLGSISPSTILDQVTLLRLGTGDAHALPGGVLPAADTDLMCWPDGSLTEATGATPLQLVFTGAAEDRSASVTLVLSPTTGAITSTTVNPKP